jgi:hypothetical protein
MGPQCAACPSMEPLESSPAELFFCDPAPPLVTTHRDHPEHHTVYRPPGPARPRTMDVSNDQSIVCFYIILTSCRLGITPVRLVAGCVLGRSPESSLVAPRPCAANGPIYQCINSLLYLYTTSRPVGHHENAGLVASWWCARIGVAAAFYPWALRGRSAHPILDAPRDAVKPELKERPFFLTAPPGGSERTFARSLLQPCSPMIRPHDLKETDRLGTSSRT